MTQSIELAEKFQPILDEVYERESKTAMLDAPTKPVNFGGADTVNVFKTDVIGLGTYSRANGYPSGQITATWEALTLSKQRGRAFTIDRMDDEETLGMAFGTLVNEFIGDGLEEKFGVEIRKSFVFCVAAHREFIG